MGLRHGRNIQIYINGVDLTGSLNEINPTSEQELADVSTFGNVGHCFYPGLAKDSGTITGLYTDVERAVFEGMIQISPSYAMMLAFGSAYGDPAYAINEVMLKSNSIKSVVTDINRISFGFDIDNYPFEECKLLSQGKQTWNISQSGNTIDNSSSSLIGGAAYLQIFSVSTGTLTLKIISSSTGIFSGEEVTTASFAAASTSGTQRIVISGTIERYCREVFFITPTTGSNCVWALALKRY